MKLVDADEVIETLHTTDDIESIFLDLAQNRRLDYLHDVEESDVVDFARDVVNAVVGVIKTSPAVDAVEVVRCKECEHHHWVQEPCHGKTIHYCELPHMRGVEVFKDFYCYYGKHREKSK